MMDLGRDARRMVQRARRRVRSGEARGRGAWSGTTAPSIIVRRAWRLIPRLDGGHLPAWWTTAARPPNADKKPEPQRHKDTKGTSEASSTAGALRPQRKGNRQSAADRRRLTPTRGVNHDGHKATKGTVVACPRLKGEPVPILLQVGRRLAQWHDGSAAVPVMSFRALRRLRRLSGIAHGAITRGICFPPSMEADSRRRRVNFASRADALAPSAALPRRCSGQVRTGLSDNPRPRRFDRAPVPGPPPRHSEPCLPPLRRIRVCDVMRKLASFRPCAIPPMR